MRWRNAVREANTRRLAAPAHGHPPPAEARQQAARCVGMPAALHVAAEIAGMEEDVAAALHLRHQQATAVARRKVRHHLVEPGRNTGAVALVAAPGRLHDAERRKAGAAQDPQRALLALLLPPKDRPLHGAMMDARARRMHRTMVRSLLSLTAAGLRPAPARARRIRGGPRSRPVASPSRTDSL